MTWGFRYGQALLSQSLPFSVIQIQERMKIEFTFQFLWGRETKTDSSRMISLMGIHIYHLSFQQIMLQQLILCVIGQRRFSISKLCVNTTQQKPCSVAKTRHT
uniref:Uncharacterized protein n=1 Tax=Rhizophora mucronata TaxID=61149 RepID=A0A2P2Q6J6_RHIMU